MFEKLSKTFSNVAKSLGEKELNEKDIEDTLSQLEISLLESDVATEVVDNIKSDLKEKLIGTKVNRKEIVDFVKKSLIQSISNMFDDAPSFDLLSNIKSTSLYFFLSNSFKNSTNLILASLRVVTEVSL